MSFYNIIERTLKRLKFVSEYVYLLSYSLTLLLSLSIKMGGYRPELDRDAADDNEPYINRKQTS
jgi:hypothetical protein